MNKRTTKIIYWIATAWLALGMVSTGLVQLLHVEEEVAVITKLGYPTYFIPLLGTWKLLGAVTVLIPRFPVLKEWAYAGFFFAMSGAVFSHLAAGSSLAEIAPSLLLLALTVVSWYFRPADRKVVSMHHSSVILS
ncbi:DoxX family protein [Rhabdobacter roseus]|uniref:DoxX family protein n=1 Tax=Rhabdobacter roseus TaxID=1655419 RepID=A0A840TLM3_9BACT|nr:DoxX family protein [Rhabdobacter roseus]MBB5284471.1 hypothetical protein [Rhabdobacter roseus]